MSPITDDTAAKLREAAEKATPGPWRKCGGATPSYTCIIAPDAYIVFGMADASIDREGNGASIVAPDMWQQQANAAFIALANPQAILALLDERDSRPMPVAYTGSGSMMALRDGREGFIWRSPSEAHPIPLYAAPLTAIAAEARSTALEAEWDAEKARADAAEAERDKSARTWRESFDGMHRRAMDAEALVLEYRHRAYPFPLDRAEQAEATISTLTAERDALKRERDEARAGLKAIAEHRFIEDADLDDICDLAERVLARTGEPKDE